MHVYMQKTLSLLNIVCIDAFVADIDNKLDA